MLKGFLAGLIALTFALAPLATEAAPAKGKRPAAKKRAPAKKKGAAKKKAPGKKKFGPSGIIFKKKK